MLGNIRAALRSHVDEEDIDIVADDVWEWIWDYVKEDN